MFYWDGLDALLVGMYEMDTSTWEVEGTAMLRGMDVVCKIVAIVMELDIDVGFVRVGC